MIGFAVYVLAARARRRGRSSSSPGDDRALGLGLAAVLLVLFVHSLLYAGFFEDPLTWGVIGLTAAALSLARTDGAGPRRVPFRLPVPRQPPPRGSAGTLTDGRRAGRAAACRKLFVWILAAVASSCSLGVAARDRRRAHAQDRLRARSTPSSRASSVSVAPTTPPRHGRRPEPVRQVDQRCWRDVRRRSAASLSRPDSDLGLPARRPLWARGLEELHRVPAELLRRRALRQHVRRRRRARSTRRPGKIVWTRRGGGPKPSTPAIDGPAPHRQPRRTGR